MCRTLTCFQVIGKRCRVQSCCHVEVLLRIRGWPLIIARQISALPEGPQMLYLADGAGGGALQAGERQVLARFALAVLLLRELRLAGKGGRARRHRRQDLGASRPRRLERLQTAPTWVLILLLVLLPLLGLRPETLP
jgi:hypothetical protein